MNKGKERADRETGKGQNRIKYRQGNQALSLIIELFL